MRLVLLCILTLCSLTSRASIVLDKDSFGQRADTIHIDIHSIPEPCLSKTKKAFVTDNKFGFDVIDADSNWVIESFLNAIKPGMLVLDAGSGYGALTRSALNRGATVISNDISKNQLLYNLRHINAEEKSRLYLNSKDIRQISLESDSLDLIVFHRILHFFNGHEIETILTRAFEWLKPGGKVYIVMLSKDHVGFRDKIFYDPAKKWPGENIVIVKNHLPDQAYALPKKLHVVSPETLENRLKEVGFQIEKVDFVSLKKFGAEANRDGKEAVGIIGLKR